MSSRKSVVLLGVQVDDVTGDEALSLIEGFIQEGTPHQVVTVNPEFVVAAQQDEEFRRILNAADLALPDGIGIVWASRLLDRHRPLRERVAGSDLVPQIAALAAERGYRLFLLGAAPGVAEEAARRLCQQNPGMTIAGIYDGSPAVEEEDDIVALVRAAKPDVLFVAYGAPAQDKWIARNLERLGVPVCMGVGGAFDFIAGVAKRAPLWMQRLGLEWLHRLWHEPWRWRRMLTLPKFMWLVVLSGFGGGQRIKERNGSANPLLSLIRCSLRWRQTFMVDKEGLLQALPKLAGRRVLVVGDIFLDEYISGRATRLSREAPIPVLEFTGRRYLPGGAANPSNNVVALGSQAQQVGVIGQDEAGQTLLAKLREARIDTEGVVTDPSRPTTTKTRIVAQGSLRFPQQLARIDRLDRRPLDENVEREIIARLTALASQADAILVSDYRTGLVTTAVVEACLRLAEEHHKLIVVDSQGDLYKYKGFNLVKCNHREAEAALGCPLRSEEDFRGALERFLGELSAQAILITRGPEGMSLLGQGQLYAHIAAANVSEVFDVTGAGDTVIAVATLSLAAGLDLFLAAHLANYAAGLVVRKLGNATATQEELAWAIENW